MKRIVNSTFTTRNTLLFWNLGFAIFAGIEILNGRVTPATLFAFGLSAGAVILGIRTKNV